MVATVVKVGAHDHLEDVHGRRVRLYPDDIVVGAYGNRYATDFFEGYLPTGPHVHLLTAGGLVGTVASAHSRRLPPTELKVIGALDDRSGRPLSVEHFARPAPPHAAAEWGTTVVVGSSMNSGKTTTASALVRGWARAGLSPGAGKVTGSGSGKDRWMYVDAGAGPVADFLDFGMSSTFGHPIGRLRTTAVAIRDALVDDGADVVVLEIADGLLQSETRALAECLPHYADGVVLTAANALDAVAGVAILDGLGVDVRAISGLVTASPLASEEAHAATGLDVVSPAQLVDGGAVDLLPGPGRRAAPWDFSQAGASRCGDAVA
ncbi:DUF1611 domain-containing protein [Streptomyces humicola]|uniref:DUF1611 domain-containing protein n=1 Tax=Streptomyces humicola TaxID=2953240 RepID=UPI002109CFA8|nr:DUF1611 domain-containing protein [Streptomyces humicola]